MTIMKKTGTLEEVFANLTAILLWNDLNEKHLINKNPKAIHKLMQKNLKIFITSVSIAKK